MRIAQALAQMARVERRTRSVTERILPPEPKKVELNSKTPAQRRAEIRVQMEQMFRKMDAEKSLHPESPHEDAHYRLVEEEGGDDGVDRWSCDLGKT